MKKPGQGDFMIGNWLCMSVFAVGTWVLAMQWLTASGSWFLTLLGVCLLHQSAKAKRRIDAWKAWRRSWNALEGAADEGQPSNGKPGRPSRTALLWLVWIVLYAYLRAHGTEPQTAGYDLLFTLWLLLTAQGAIAALLMALRFTRGHRAAGRRRSEREHTVSVCLPVPPSATPGTASSIAAELPDYCRALLQRADSDHLRQSAYRT